MSCRRIPARAPDSYRAEDQVGGGGSPSPPTVVISPRCVAGRRGRIWRPQPRKGLVSSAAPVGGQAYPNETLDEPLRTERNLPLVIPRAQREEVCPTSVVKTGRKA